MYSQFMLLKERRFLPLFITQFLGAFNDNVFKNALVVWLTYALANDSSKSNVMVTVAAGIFILPFFLFSAIAGQVADKFEKTTLIRNLKLGEIILMLFASMGLYHQNEVLLLVTLFLLGVQATFFGPVKYSILPDQLAKDELLSGNGLIEAGTFIAIFFGTILGGLLIMRSHGAIVLSLFLIFVAIAGWIGSYYIPKVTRADKNLPINKNIIKESFQIIKTITKDRVIFLSVLGISWIWFIGATFLAQFPIFGKEVLKVNEQVVTLLVTMFTLGVAAGSILCNKLLKGRIETTYLPICALVITLFSFDLYFTCTHIVHSDAAHLLDVRSFLATRYTSLTVLGDLFLIAMASGMYIVPLYSLLQLRVKATERSRTIAANNIVNAFFMVMSAAISSAMLAIGFSIPQVFLMVALINVAVAVYICQLLPKALLKSVLRTCLKYLYRVQVDGLEHYYQAGKRVVIIANHTSFIDVVLLAAFLPDDLTFAVNTEVAQAWWLKPLLKFVNCFPIDPTNPMAIKSLIDHVKQDHRLLIFPEGRLTVTGTLMKIYDGPGMIADRSKAPILPIRIEGAQYTPFSRLKGKVRINFFSKIKLTILPAQCMTIATDAVGRKRRQLISSKLHSLMTEMMFESSERNRTLFQSLLDAQVIHGNNHQIIEDVSQVQQNYQQLIMASFVLGRKIAKQSLAGEFLGLLLPNMVGTMITFFSMQAYNRVPVMLNYTSGVSAIISACKTAKVSRIYTSRKFIKQAKLDTVVEAIRCHEFEVIYLEDVKAALTFRDKLIGWALSLFPTISYKKINGFYKKRTVKAGHLPAVVLFTSGSEGDPKGVVLSHNNIQSNRYQISSCIDFNGHDKIFNALPLFHSFGLTAGALLPILSGMKTYFYPSPLHYRIIPELVYAINATILFGTDTFLANYAKYANSYDFYSTRYIFAGAEKLKDATRKLWIEKFGVRIFEGYGVTEASPVLAMNTPMRNKVGSVGKLLPGIHHQIENIQSIEQGGRLFVKGPNVMLGYLFADKPGEIQSLPSGWHDTGDIVEIDSEGYLFIKGRVKRFAKIAGEMVSLTAIETAISDLWPNYLHAVVVKPDAKKGEQITLVTNYSVGEREQLVAYFKQQGIADIAIPKEIINLEKIPLLPTGKIDYINVQALMISEQNQ